MSKKKQTTNRVHDPADVAEIAAAYGCSDRHARRLLSELGKDYALQMRDLQAEKLRLQIKRAEMWLDDAERKYVHVQEINRQRDIVVRIVRQALDELKIRLVRELPGLTAPQMCEKMQDAVHDCLQRMADLADAEPEAAA